MMVSRAIMAERAQGIEDLSEFDAVYLAGLLEGEGSFFLFNGRPRVSLTMTDEDVVTFVRDMIGFGNVRPENRAAKGWSTTYTLVTTGAPAAALMRRILPYMGKRRTCKITEVLGA